MIPISVCIIAKNEEKNIGQCLEPLMPYGFEIIVVDTGSTDGTKETALKYTDKVYDFEWVNDFSAARNFSLQKASHNYVLVLDCDEFLIDIDIDAIYHLLEEHPRGVGMILRNDYYDLNGTRENSPHRVERLFHKRYYHYIYSIHENVADIKTDGTYFERFDIPFIVDHVGYCGNEDEKNRKVERNNSLLFKEIEKNPDDPYFYFQVGQSFNSVEDYENAYIYYNQAFALPISPDQPWLPIIATAYLNSMNQTGRSEEALTFFQPLYEQFCKDTDFLCNMGVAYLQVNQPLKAMMEFVKAVQTPTDQEQGSNTYIPYYNMGYINEMLGNLPAAVNFYQKSASYGYPLALQRLSELGIPLETKQ